MSFFDKLKIFKRHNYFYYDKFHFLSTILWKFFWKPIFFSIDPEKVHHLVVNVMKLIKPLLAFNTHKYTFKYNFRNNKYLEREVFGIKFPNPVGLAAGFDKNAEIYKQMHDHGFGFIEIGGNIGKNKDTPNEKAADDYLICFQKLYDHVDYFAVNVSSPNTPHLRDLQNTEGLRSILIPLIDENKKRSNKPILLKISPDLNNSDVLSIVDLIQELKIDGIITTNTTLSREKLKSDNKLKSQKGGLSGAPLRKRSTEVISLIHKYSKGNVPIIGVGGIMSADDALEKLNAGASLIQVYTGFIYNGPSFIYKINREIIKSLN